MAHDSDSSKRPQALVTGASAGIGLAFAEHLAADGHDLILVARRRDRLDSLAKTLGQKHGVAIEVLAADLIDSAELREVEARAAAAPGLDLLVNNAGFGTSGPFVESEPEAEAREIQLNVLALSALTRAALPPMVERGSGAVINVSSLAGFGPGPYNATYSATKAFVTSFSEALAEEVRGSGVVVQALCPGFTRTEFQDVAGVEVSDLPSFAWMEADSVVDASLAALRSGDVLCVPGLGNQAAAWAVRGLPRRLVARAYGTIMAGRLRSAKD